MPENEKNGIGERGSEKWEITERQDRKRSGKRSVTVRSQNRQPECAGIRTGKPCDPAEKYAEDFKKFAERNPKPCPILEIMDGSPLVHDMGEGANIVTDIPAVLYL